MREERRMIRDRKEEKTGSERTEETQSPQGMLYKINCKPEVNAGIFGVRSGGGKIIKGISLSIKEGYGDLPTKTLV